MSLIRVVYGSSVKRTREMVVNLRRTKTPITAVSIEGEAVELVQSYRYLGVHLGSKLDWSVNTEAIYQKGQSRLQFLRRIRSFGVCRTMLNMFYQLLVASALFFAVVCWQHKHYGHQQDK